VLSVVFVVLYATVLLTAVLLRRSLRILRYLHTTLHNSSKYSIDLSLKAEHEGSHLVRKAPSPPGMESWLQEEHKVISTGNVAAAAKAPTLSQSKQNQLSAKKQQMAMAVAVKPGYVVYVTSLTGMYA
jgi:hypothetical protein